MYRKQTRILVARNADDVVAVTAAMLPRSLPRILTPVIWRPIITDDAFADADSVLQGDKQ